MSQPDEVLEWIEEHAHNLDGQALELTPWQRAIFDGRVGPISFREAAAAGHRAGRRRAQAQTIAAALLIDERDVVIATSDELAGRRAIADVRAALEELERGLGVPVPIDDLVARVRVTS